MDNQLPSEFDLIVIGTGMIESIVSAAASRIGKRVLHIDKDEYYGGNWASFNLETIQKISQQKCGTTLHSVNLSENEKSFDLGNSLFNLENFEFSWNIPSNVEVSNENSVEKLDNTEKAPDVFTQEKLLKESRKFNIDLTPKLQFSRGNFVELLISSNIARYSEYRSVSRVLTWVNSQLEIVPCSRSDVFANKRVSVIEKRMLMKLLTSLEDNSEELKNLENKTFKQFLKERKLTPSLIHYVLYAISMSTDDTPCLEGIENTKRFVNSLGRFGKTPFLFAMYGSGESPQAFCRLSAVFGGVFALCQPITSLIFEGNKCKSLVCGKQKISSENFVIGVEKAPVHLVENIKKDYISRAVFITDRSVMDSEKEHLTLLLYPPEDSRNSVTVIEMGSLTGTCPKNTFIVHMISRQKTNPKDDFKHVIENLFTSENTEPNPKPRILCSCYFSLPDTSSENLLENVFENLFLCSGPDLDLDYDLCIKKARAIFEKMYPDLEFLPRAPDPEEIIIEGEEEQQEVRSDKEENEIIDKLVENLKEQNGDQEESKKELKSSLDSKENEET